MLLQSLVQSKDDLAVGETVEGEALLLHPLHGPDLLVLLLGQLGEVEVQHGEAPAGDVAGGEAVHHQHRPDRSLPLPVAGDGVVEIIRVQAPPRLVLGDPVLHLEPDPLQVVPQSQVDVGRQDLGEVQAAGQQLAGGEGGDGVGIGQIQLEIYLVRGLNYRGVNIILHLSRRLGLTLNAFFAL